MPARVTYSETVREFQRGDITRTLFFIRTRAAARRGDQAAIAELRTRGRVVPSANNCGARRELRRNAASASASVERFGVEIEFNGCDAQAVVSVARTIGGIDIQVENYNHSIRNYWKIVTDGSCGLELVSPPLSLTDGFEQVRKACAALRMAGARVDTRCGLHVHLDVSRLDVEAIKRAIASYAANQDAINSILARSRHSSTYATPWNRAELAQIERCTNLQDIAARVGTRYKTVNVAAFTRYGTIEFRQHQGTLNAEKIVNWIQLVRALVVCAQDRAIPAHSRSSLQTLLQALRLSNETQAFFQERAMELA